MASLTCVIDARCLIDHVHEIKNLVYGGEVSLHLPICTSENVEKIYQSSLLQKESQKEPPSKKPASKVSGRKEQHPLFDLNPQIAREFLLRSQSKTDQAVNDIVTFQLAGQQFTQWKNEEEKAIKAEQPPEQPPSSFAQALLRKLNIVEEDNGPKAPAKPRLVAKDAAINKTPWKYHKVPDIPSAGISLSLKPLLSCILWRLYEYENNPLKPQTFVLATGDKETIAMAKKLGIPLQDIKQLCAQMAEKLKTQDTRDQIGQEEARFGVKLKEKASPAVEAEVLPMEDAVHGEEKVNIATSDTTEPSSSSVLTQLSAVVDIPPADVEVVDSLPTAIEVRNGASSSEDMSAINEPVSGNLGESNAENVAALTLVLIDEAIPASEPIPEPEALNAAQKLARPLAPPNMKAAQMVKVAEPVSEDEDSDVDIVVFKPKSRPGSSYMKKGPEATKPSPPKSYTQVVTQAVQAIAQGQPKARTEQPVRATSIKYEASPLNVDSPKQPVTVQEPILEEPIPVLQPQKLLTPLSYTAALEMGLPKKAPVKPRPMTPINGPQETKSTPVSAELPVPQSSHLAVNSPRSRPQTPRGGHGSGQNGFQNQSRHHHHRPQTPRDTGNQHPQHSDHRRSKRQSPPRTHQPKTIHSRSPSGEPSQPPPAPAVADTIPPPPVSSETALHPHSSNSSSSGASSHKGNGRPPSEGPANAPTPGRGSRLKQAGHPSYPRFNQVSAKAQRVAQQQQPTTAPIVIDADSFDRSSYVKPTFQAIQAHNMNAHAVNAPSQYAGMNGSGRFAGGRGAAVGGRAVSRNADGDVDFVLKSGTPRGRGRGTGRLWVP